MTWSTLRPLARRTLVCGAIALLATFTTARSPALEFTDAQWIWTSAGFNNDLNTIPAETAYFRTDLSIPESPALRSAQIIITCDNLFVLYINGQAVGESSVAGDSWRQPRRWDLMGQIAPGRVSVAVEALNTAPSPAGLLARLEIELADGSRITRVTDGSWRASPRSASNWQQPDFDDQEWDSAIPVGAHGDGPWGPLTVPEEARPGGEPVGQVYEVIVETLQEAAAAGRMAPVVEREPDADFVWPEEILFVADDRTLYRPYFHTDTAMDSLTVTLFNPRKSRGFPEHDLPGPVKVGGRLVALRPGDRDAAPRVVLDAGSGALGAPSVSFCGQWVYVSMAFEDTPFFHIYRVSAQGGEPEQLTHGPFHDIDPIEAPDGRILFISTRIGYFEEYHNPPARALFAMAPDGSDIHPLTHTIIFDNDPEILADGRILLVRSDNFFGRGKVETLLHAVYPDGTRGQTEFGLDMGPEYGMRLRAFVCGNPAAMPDGRVAFVSNPGITIGRPGAPSSALLHFSFPAGDVGALPDGRLLTTTPRQVVREMGPEDRRRAVNDIDYDKICVLDPHPESPLLTVIYDSPGEPLHSPVYLGPRTRPMDLHTSTRREDADSVGATGYLYSQNVRATQHTTAGWEHVRAIRVFAGKGLTVRSSHSYIVHAGNETVELGTVPLAADGSFYIEVPADTPIALQAVDGEGRSELNEMSWIFVRPGEQRGCVGCHHKRQVAPDYDARTILATQERPLRLVGQGDPHRYRGNNAAVTGLMELQMDRFREVAALNRHGDTGDPVATGRDEVAALVAALEGPDQDLKISAAQRLSIFRCPSATSALVACLDDSEVEVRVSAALALGACGDRSALSALIAALDDSSSLVGQSAAIALEHLTGQSAPYDGFAPVGERGGEAWRQWVDGAAIDQAIPTLVAQLDTDDRVAVRQAAVALGRLKAVSAREALEAYVARERENNPYPEWRIRHWGDEARFNALSPANPRTLQAVTRALGWLGDERSVPLLAETLGRFSHPDDGNLFLAEAAAEALGRIGGAEAEQALIDIFPTLAEYPRMTFWYGDHDALIACHASPVHYFILEALDTMGSVQVGPILPHLIRSLPTDPDRALFPFKDDYETLVGRMIRRAGAEAAVVETCLALLGDATAKSHPEYVEAISHVHPCWGGTPCPQNRAAQVLSMVGRDRRYEPAIRAAFVRYQAVDDGIPRVFDHGIPIVQQLPLRHWVCFYLARALGQIGDPASVDVLLSALTDAPPEAADGYPDPLGPGILFLHNDLTPAWRAAAAWALGQIGDRRATPVLLAVVGDLKNATDTRSMAVAALARLADPTSAQALALLAESYPEVSTRRAMREALEQLDEVQYVGSGE